MVTYVAICGVLINPALLSKPQSIPVRFNLHKRSSIHIGDTLYIQDRFNPYRGNLVYIG
jgi:hypothetical protein